MSSEAPIAAKAPIGEPFHSHVPRYIATFVALAVLTLLELGVVYMHLAKSTTILLLVGLAVTKAAAVALIFMHLWDEKPALRRLVAIPLLFPPLYALVLIAEAAFRGTFMLMR